MLFAVSSKTEGCSAYVGHEHTQTHSNLFMSCQPACWILMIDLSSEQFQGFVCFSMLCRWSRSFNMLHPNNNHMFLERAQVRCNLLTGKLGERIAVRCARITFFGSVFSSHSIVGLLTAEVAMGGLAASCFVLAFRTYCLIDCTQKHGRGCVCARVCA